MKLKLSIAFAICIAVTGCASLIDRATGKFANQLSAAILNTNDPATIRDGLPAYLILLDAMIEGEPNSVDTLLAAANLNGAYSGNFVASEDASRKQRLAAKAMSYARRAVCVEQLALCEALTRDPQSFEIALAKISDREIKLFYGLASAWSGYIQAYRDDWDAIADLPKLEAVLNRVVAIDPNYQQGMPLVYLGVLNSLRPEAIGGQPEKGRAYFERAWEISGQRNLFAKTLQAEFNARLLFDQKQHDALLQDVIAADPIASGFTLMNTLAQQRAVQLLESGKDYF